MVRLLPTAVCLLVVPFVATGDHLPPAEVDDAVAYAQEPPEFGTAEQRPEPPPDDRIRPEERTEPILPGEVEVPSATAAILPGEGRETGYLRDGLWSGSPQEHAARFEAYEAHYRDALEAACFEHGVQHEWTADAARRLGRLYEDVGDYGRATPRYERAAAIFDALDLADNWRDASNDLIRVALQQGEFDRAEALLQTRRERSPGPDADLLTFSAALYLLMGDFARAEPLYQQLVALREVEYGYLLHWSAERSLGVALHNLGVYHERVRDYDRAEPLLRREVEIARRLADQFPRDFAHSLDSLGVVLMWQGRLAEAEECLVQSAALYQDELGERHPEFARTISNQGALCIRLRDFARAEKLLLDAAELRRSVLGELHLDRADSLADLALLYRTWDRPAEAVTAIAESLRITRWNMDLLAHLQSERQQLATAQQFRERLDLLLGAMRDAGSDPAEAYAHWLGWKGEVFRHQQLARLVGEDPTLTETRQLLQRVCGRLSALTFSASGMIDRPEWAEARQAELRELDSQREQMESELARLSAPYETAREQQRYRGEDVRRVLVSGSVLLDFAEWTDRTIAADGTLQETPQLLVFVLRPDRPIERVEVGPAEPVYRLVDQWRELTARRGSMLPAAALAAGEELRRRLWEPLSGAVSDAGTILISPDGELGKLPFAALPGSEPDMYLLDAHVIGIVPVPQLLPAQASAAVAAEEGPESLLLLGDVDYGMTQTAATGAPGDTTLPDTWRGPRLTFPGLTETFAETATIERRFRRSFPDAESLLLDRDGASEAAFRRDAPTHRYMHLATHGFFAPDNLRTALSSLATRTAGPIVLAGDRPWADGVNPGLLSGIALAGANLPAGEIGDDGILTTLEVAAMDLSQVDLAVLSACQTGLGQAAGGEGLLGLQRGFQMAGARSVVATLWMIDDQATRQLMDRFYENLWEKRMGKAEALREAQLWMMREGESRHLLFTPEEPVRPKRLPPYYWAAFVLSGDWR